ncbi:MAG: PEP-CTERM sorting domain-containing protein [Chromatiaceae bacterium]|nr:PEP-CTERM sorting domain-containing protein [Chromatiaceae bacterium]MCF8003024.1 PEP-CTERM sorting domain-containing protein [Chromatiaceae bacterium]
MTAKSTLLMRAFSIPVLMTAVSPAFSGPLLGPPTPEAVGSNSVMAVTNGPVGSELGEYKLESGDGSIFVRAGDTTSDNTSLYDFWNASYNDGNNTYGYWYRAVGEVTGSNALKAYAGASGSGVEDYKWSAKGQASHTEIFTLSSSSAATTRVNVTVNLAYDGHIEVGTNGSTYNESGNIESRAEAKFSATANYLNPCDNPYDLDCHFESEPLGVMGSEVWAYSNYNSSDDSNNWTSGWGKALFNSDQNGQNSGAENQAGIGIDDSGFFEFTVDQLDKAITLNLSLATEAYVKGQGGSEIFKGYAHSSFADTATFEFFSFEDPDNADADITMTPFSTSSPVPEPTSLSLVGLGAIGALAIRRRRRSSRSSVSLGQADRK